MMEHEPLCPPMADYMDPDECAVCVVIREAEQQERQRIVDALREWVSDDPVCQCTLDAFGFGYGVQRVAWRIEHGDFRRVPVAKPRG